VGLIGLIVLFPLTAGLILLVTGRRWPGSTAGWAATAGVAGSFVVAVLAAADLLTKPFHHRHMVTQLYRWIAAGSFHVDMALRADPLSILMALTVSGVAALIFVYSIGYMAGDRRYGRYFAYVSLFVFFMLLLVLANNFLVLYIGWEGVGLCSYLLIGHWFERKSAADAAKKAFIVTRIGDAAFLIGIIVIWTHFHTLNFEPIFRATSGLANGTATVISLLLLAGAVGKSAQMPLHTWLPDAMEGPTPVSALIHAATMVTAGVYLIVRTHVIFEASSTAPTIVATVGVVTAIYAGLAAIGQDDIKRTLAYSTMSQIGFMFFGAGVGAYSAAIFLLVAHAFFKALLFLSAGSVIHGLDDEQDMMKMGGLRAAMPATAAAWILGALAMAGIPPLSGFFAKDQVVAAASTSGHTGLWIAALVGALLTAVYITRATFMTFFGERRFASEAHPDEPPAVMSVPMIALAAAAAAGGVLGLSATNGLITRFLGPVIRATHRAASGPSEVVLSIISVVVALVGILLAYFVYGSGRIDWIALRMRFAGWKRAAMRGFYVDDVYGAAIGGPGRLGSAFLAYVVERRVVDGATNGLATIIGTVAATGRRVQSGLVRVYALAFLVGVVGILGYLAVRAS
jgi:NADH-quinone oxidoreductase subunit L